ncbi:MAG: tRNA (adenosine(37)-N6)-dimethylallyltransferase MiaA [Clostridiales bacterium]|jgi:tRNA dimethylallyltransferase|nr:tRNA (adenosine(37)-N6)-dimethylallyltransferase MiaA [Clostridiales bacterium]
MKKTPLLVITGPTSTGKTALAIKIAQVLNGEIISADSMQIYRYMDIGTAKPTIEERKGIPHYMLDIVYPDEEYNVALFQKQAMKTIEDISKRGRLPILAGGTGLYINSIIYPMDFSDAEKDPEYRNYLKKRLKENGVLWLHNQLKKVDLKSAERLHPNDTRRIIRALEIYHLTGKPMTAFHQNYKEMEPPYDLLLYGLTMERQILYERINLRVDCMIEAGLVDEVRGLLKKGYTKDLVSMQGLGYKEIVAYLKGLVTLNEAIEVLKRNTRRFAKRQLTWFRREKQIKWLYADKQTTEQLAEQLISDIGKNNFLIGAR